MNKKNVTYKQCVMKKPSEKGYKTHVAWIPKKFAVVGKFIKIDGYGNGWEVVNDGGNIELSSTEADNASQAHKKTRKASDI